MASPSPLPADIIYRVEQLTQRLEKGGASFTLGVPGLDIRAGEFVAIVGESGCGKTTLLDLLGLIAAPSGARRFDLGLDPERSVSALGLGEGRRTRLRRRHLGYVLQRGGLLPFLTVGENILLPQRVNGMGGRAARDEAWRLAGELGIADHWDKKAAFLSGGQRQRVAIARALAHEPTVILADEPTGAVDKVTAREIRDLLQQAARERNATVIVVTHDEPLLAGKTDRLFTFEVERTGPGSTRSMLVETTWATRRVGGASL